MTVETKPKAGLEDVVAGESAICYIDGDRGVLAYQGYDIHDLANADKGVSFEETCFLLWHGRLPNRSELGDLQTQLASARALQEPILRAMNSLPKRGGHGRAAHAHVHPRALRPGRGRSFAGRVLPQGRAPDRAARVDRRHLGPRCRRRGIHRA